MTNAPENTGGRKQLFSLGSLSIRNRLVWGSIAIVVLAVGIMSMFIYLQVNQASENLMTTMDSVTLEESKNSINSIADRQSESLSTYFAELEKSVLSLRDFNQNLFDMQSAYASGSYWDASTSLRRNANGSWDNSNSDPVSIFIPAASDLTSSMATDVNTMRHMDLTAPSVLDTNPDVIAVYFGGTSGYTLYYPNIDLASIVPADFDVTNRPWYLSAAPAENPEKNAVWSAPYLDAALNGIVITNSAPVYDSRGGFKGVVAEDIQLTRISNAINSIQVMDTGYAFLVDSDRRLIAMPDAGYEFFGINPESMPLGSELTSAVTSIMGPEFESTIQQMISGDSGLAELTLRDQEYFMVYRPVEGVNFSLAILAPKTDLVAEASAMRGQIEESNRYQLLATILVILGIISLTVIVTNSFSNRMTEPLTALTNAARDMERGELYTRVNIFEKNEFGTLADTLNSMAERLSDLFGTLEKRVTERTAEVQERSQELERANQKANRRASQLAALAQVAQSIASVRDLEELLPRVADVISKNYGFYHVGVFLLDSIGEYAVLAASNSEGGRKMLENKHRLKVGEQGIVGAVTGSGDPRIALDVGADAVFFNNPLLPETHSEMALPLRSGGRIIGALDVQSIESAAFTDEDVQTLTLLADQVSLAIENARLIQETQKALAEQQFMTRQATREAWKRIPDSQNVLGYRFSAMGSSPLREKVVFHPSEEGSGLHVVPIELRGEVIGKLIVQSANEADWDDDQRDLIKSVAERVALAAENARLFEETTQRAERERLVSDITGKIRSQTDPQTMIETAINELRSVLGASRVEVIPQSNGKKKGEE